MEQTGDVARGDWLVARAGAWGTIGGSVGMGFDAYARVLHPVPAHLEDRTRVDEWGDHPVVRSAVWRWSDVADRTGGALHPTVSWSGLTGVHDGSDVSFPDGWRITPPEEGWLDPTVLAVLVGHLAAATSTPEDLLAGIWDGWADLSGGSTLAFAWQPVEGEPPPTDAEWAAMRAEAERKQAGHRAEQDALVASLAGPRVEWPNRTLIPFRTSASELTDPTWPDRFRVGSLRGIGRTPQLLWPETRQWAMASEIDLDSTLVGGSVELVEEILDDPRLEAFGVRESDELG